VLEGTRNVVVELRSVMTATLLLSCICVLFWYRAVSVPKSQR
jgi:hypothetical protein